MFLCILFVGFNLLLYTSSLEVHLQTPVLDIQEDGTYMCFKTPIKEYTGMSLVGFAVESVKEVAHHAVVLVCEDVNSNEDYWDCTRQQGHISKGRAVGLNGKDKADIEHFQLNFPTDVGIELGQDAKINYMVVQVHYKHKYFARPGESSLTNVTLFLSQERKKYTRQAAIMLSKGHIPARTERYSSEQIIRWSGIAVEVDSYAIHSHDHGLLIESYIIKNDEISLIGRHSPHQRGTLFYNIPNNNTLLISPGDVIVARCVFRNPNDDPILFGTGHGNEMCSFSINFKVPTESALVYPRTLVSSQNPQEISWCNNTIYMSADLCALSRIEL